MSWISGHVLNIVIRDVARVLIGEPGVYIHIFVFCPTSLFSNQMLLWLISKQISWAEDQYVNKHPPQLNLQLCPWLRWLLQQMYRSSRLFADTTPYCCMNLGSSWHATIQYDNTTYYTYYLQHGHEHSYRQLRFHCISFWLIWLRYLTQFSLNYSHIMMLVYCLFQYAFFFMAIQAFFFSQLENALRPVAMIDFPCAVLSEIQYR